MSSVAMKIELLRQEPELIRTVSEWHQAEWAHLSDRGIEDRIAEFAEHGEGLPCTLVGFLAGAPIGTASLLVEDMDIHKDLSPWLGSVFVLPEHRRQGYGARLVKGIMAHGQKLGASAMYLFTEDRAGFYAAMGWQVLELRPYHGEEVTIMKLDLGTIGGV